MVENPGLEKTHFRENECEEEESIVRNSQKEMEREKTDVTEAIKI